MPPPDERLALTFQSTAFTKPMITSHKGCSSCISFHFCFRSLNTSCSGPISSSIAQIKVGRLNPAGVWLDLTVSMGEGLTMVPEPTGGWRLERSGREIPITLIAELHK